MPKLSNGNSGYCELVVYQGREPGLQLFIASLCGDDHVGVDDYFHLSTGGSRNLRASSRSFCQARRSSSESRTFRSAAANSAPVQPLRSAGTSWATGSPFLWSTK